MGGGRTDFNLTNTMKLFYRYNHDDNIGVTGFGGVGSRPLPIPTAPTLTWSDGTTVPAHGFTAVRFSFLKFINGIVDANSLAGTPANLPAQVNITGLGGFVIGPNANAPQATFQQNRQTKYDASYVKGRHTIQFGVEYNRIDEAGFASFFGLGPRVRGPFTGGVAPDPFSADGAGDPLNYIVSGIFLGNGLGAGSEKPALGLPERRLHQQSLRRLCARYLESDPEFHSERRPALQPRRRLVQRRSASRASPHHVRR